MKNLFFTKIFLVRLIFAAYLSFLLIVSSSQAASPLIGPTASFADIVEPLMPAVVNISTVKYAKKKQKKGLSRGNRDLDHFQELFEHFGMPNFLEEMPSNPRSTSLGSGFLISSDGEIVTNHHVIQDADEIMVKLNDNKEYKAKLIGSDQKTDIALLKIETKESLPFVKFGNSSKARVGDWIIAIGNPFGLGGTVTAGIISAKSRDIDIISGGLIDDYIQTDAAINGGNSGGPMFNIEGEVIGVNTAILTPSGTNIGIGFAIPANPVQNIVTQLKAKGKIERGKLGIRIQELTPELAEGLGAKEDKGTLIAGVDPGSAGEKAGLKAGDIIVGFNNQEIKSMRKFQIMVAETPVNKEVDIKVLRGGKEVSLKAKIEESADNKTSENPLSNKESKSLNLYEFNKIEFSDLTSDLAEKYSIKDQEGVVVVSVQSETTFNLLSKGDLIVAMNKKQIKNLEDFKAECESSKKLGMKNVAFLIKRNSMTLYVSMPII